jgi:hypothetical protein
MSDSETRKVCLYVLIFHKKILKRLASFTENVSGCNFTMRAGWQKSYIDKHGVGEYRPELRAVDTLDLYHITLSDTVTLTEDQYVDFKRITLLGYHPESDARHAKTVVAERTRS